jgi:HTH-type transcriptional regulator/antitoxin HigA
MYDPLVRTDSMIGSMHKRFETGVAMDIKPIRTKRDYGVALRTIETLMTAKRGTAEGDQLNVLATLVEAYEAKHFPLDLLDPVEAIKLVMEQRNLTVKDLVPHIGQPNRVYEVLNHKRPLTIAMVWKLHRGLGIPAESLIKQAA